MAEVEGFLRRLLVAVADADERQSGAGYINPRDAAIAAGLLVRGGWIAKAIPHFVANGWVRELPQLHGLVSGDRSYLIELTLGGLVEAERIRNEEQAGVAFAGDAVFPAADRFVLRSDNEAAFSEATEKLAALAEAVRGTNDLFADADERLAVAQEVEGIRDLLSLAKVRVSAIWAAISGNGVVRWLSNAVGQGIVSQVASGAMALLARLISVRL